MRYQRYAQAIVRYQANVGLAQQLVALEPGQARWRYDVVLERAELGFAFMRRGGAGDQKKAASFQRRATLCAIRRHRSAYPRHSAPTAPPWRRGSRRASPPSNATSRARSPAYDPRPQACHRVRHGAADRRGTSLGAVPAAHGRPSAERPAPMQPIAPPPAGPNCHLRPRSRYPCRRRHHGCADAVAIIRATT